MASYRHQLTHPQAMAQNAMYHHAQQQMPMAAHQSYLYSRQPWAQAQQHSQMMHQQTQHHHMLTRHYLSQQHGMIRHHPGIGMGSAMPLNASKYFF